MAGGNSAGFKLLFLDSNSSLLALGDCSFFVVLSSEAAAGPADSSEEGEPDNASA